MTSTAETSTALAAAYAGLARSGPAWPDDDQAAGTEPAQDHLLADAMRGLVQQFGGADHPGLPSSATSAASVLWARFRRYDAADPGWPDRDRFVLSPGHGALLRRALRRLTGHDDPDPEDQPDIETGAGPLGEGFGAAIGMALAERFLAARFGRSLVDHRTWMLACDGDLMQGVSHEAASLAGHLRLDRLTVLWGDAVSAEDAAGSEDTLRRFAAYGWATRRVDGCDHAALAAALGMALRSRKPTLIACRDPDPAAARPRRGSSASLPEAVFAGWRAAGQRGAAARRSWLKRLAHHPRRAEFERVTAGRLPESLSEVLQALKSAFAASRAGMTTRAASERVVAALSAVLPELVGGTADPAQPSVPSALAGAGGFVARFLHFGMREHGMAAAMNGMAAHGGVLPYGSTVSVLSDAVRPALRVAALTRSRLVHVLTHDVRAAGTAAAAHPPVEHLASLRAVPNLQVLRPADAVETAECWELALRRTDGPSLLVLGRDEAPNLRAHAQENRCAQGGYVLAEAEGPRHATLIATGSEVALALAARARLAAERIAVAVVSLPCWELFASAGAAHHARVLGEALRFGIEAGSGFGWERWLGPGGVFIGCEDDAAIFDFTPEAIAVTVRRRLAA